MSVLHVEKVHKRERPYERQEDSSSFLCYSGAGKQSSFKLVLRNSCSVNTSVWFFEFAELSGSSWPL